MAKPKKWGKTRDEDFHLLIEILERLKIPYFLTGGTLLGAVRDQKFPPGDRDIDLGIMEEDLEGREEELEEACREVFKRFLFRRHRKYLKVYQALGARTENEQWIWELMIYFKRGNLRYHAWWNTLFSFYTDSLFKPYRKIEFLGRMVSIPNKSEELLKEMFGNWRVPQNMREWKGPGTVKKKGSLPFPRREVTKEWREFAEEFLREKKIREEKESD